MDIKPLGQSPTIAAQNSLRKGCRNQSLLAKAYSVGFEYEAALVLLSRLIKLGKFTPFYSRDEAEKLFSLKQITYQNGTYRGSALDSLTMWQDMLNNCGAAAKADLDYILSKRAISKAERIETAADYRTGARTLKAIEDQIFHYLTDQPEIVKPGEVMRPGFRPKFGLEIVRKILIVDDERNLLLAGKYSLANLNLEVVTVDPKQRFMEQLLQLTAGADFGGFDLVIMDGNLRETTGTRLTELLRAKQFKGYIVTNSASRDETARMRAAGADLSIADKDIGQIKNFFFDPSQLLLSLPRLLALPGLKI